MKRRDDDHPSWGDHIIPHDDPRLAEYSKLLAVLPQADVELLAGHNSLFGFRPNAAVQRLVQMGAFSLNDDVWDPYLAGKTKYEDVMQLYQLIGYSLDGFMEVFGEEIESMYAGGVCLVGNRRVTRASLPPSQSAAGLLNHAQAKAAEYGTRVAQLESQLAQQRSIVDRQAQLESSFAASKQRVMLLEAQVNHVTSEAVRVANDRVKTLTLALRDVVDGVTLADLLDTTALHESRLLEIKTLAYQKV